MEEEEEEEEEGGHNKGRSRSGRGGGGSTGPPAQETWSLGQTRRTPQPEKGRRAPREKTIWMYSRRCPEGEKKGSDLRSPPRRHYHSGTGLLSVHPANAGSTPDPLSTGPSNHLILGFSPPIHLQLHFLTISCVCVFLSSFSTVPYCSYTHFDRHRLPIQMSLNLPPFPVIRPCASRIIAIAEPHALMQDGRGTNTPSFLPR